MNDTKKPDETLFTMHFPTEDIKLKLCMRQDDILAKIKAESPDMPPPRKVTDVYDEIYFPPAPDHRPYTYGSLVLSMDGKIAFPDNPEGPLIAAKNFLDPAGGKADFWVLNMLRAYADCAVIGARTLQAEPNGTSHVFCEEMAAARTLEMGKTGISPWNAVVSFDGTDIPFDHVLFEKKDIRAIIGTSPQGAEYVKKHIKKEIISFGPFNGETPIPAEEIKTAMERQPRGVLLISTGNEEKPDAMVFLKVLRLIGVQRAVIESPMYMWHLMEHQAMDEVFFNYSSVFVGGDIALGSYKPFTTALHPHSRVVSMAYHKSNFIFTRQQFVYDVKET